MLHGITPVVVSQFLYHQETNYDAKRSALPTSWATK
ncbi:hypothetical protein HALO153_20192 [Vreelandella titanicae]|nr:hypothetical protein HALO153_20192 [Halomonas titanicae]